MSARARASSVIDGTVTHVRSGDVRHRFRYRYRSFLLDLDELPSIERRAWPVFGVDRARPVSLRTADHLATEQGATIRERVHACLRRHDIEPPADGRITGLVTLRGLGTGFDPVTLWFAYAATADEPLAAIVVDVHNTYRESHPYVLQPDPDDAERWVRATLDKRFHVSPFLDRDGAYEVSVLAPTATAATDGDRFVLRIDYRSPTTGDRVVAVQEGRRVALRGPRLAGMVLARPLQGLRSAALIRFEALRLHRRGATFRAKPPYAAQAGHPSPRTEGAAQ